MKIRLKKFKTVKSTNDIAIRLIKKKISTPTLIIAERQTNGRGRIGKKWVSKKGNLFITIFFRDYSLNLYPGATINFDLGVVFSSLLVQVTSALPLSWKIANAPAHESLTKITYSGLIIFSVFSLFFTAQLNKVKGALAVLRFQLSYLFFL